MIEHASAGSSPASIGGSQGEDQQVSIAEGIVTEINRFRRDPKRYAEEMAQLRGCYEGNVLKYPNTGCKVETVEGPASLEDCIQDLLLTPQLPSLTDSQLMGQCCEQHFADLRDKDMCSHMGSDGSTPEDRLAAYGEHKEQCGENIVFGMRSARDAVYHMLIDDGSPERGHRANLLNIDFHFVGVAHGPHASMISASVLLFVDHFKAKRVGAMARMRSVAEHATGVPVGLEGDGHVATVRAWDGLMQAAKPDYLQVPERVRGPTERQAHGWSSRVIQIQHKFQVGDLIPKPSINPAIVRAFVHRVDSNFDDRVEEPEMVTICHHNMLNVSPQQVSQMFDDILAMRPWTERQHRAVGWMEIFLALRPRKRWVPVINVHVEAIDDGQRLPEYDLIVEMSALEKWCDELYGEFGERCSLNAPTGAASTGVGANKKKGTAAAVLGQGKGSAKTKDVNAFLESLLAAMNPDSGELLQRDMRIQSFLKTPQDQSDSLASKPRVVRRARCMNQRQLWVHEAWPHRKIWLDLMRAVGLDPVVKPLASHDGPTAKTVEHHLDAQIADQQRLNKARPEKTTYSGLPPGLETMKIKDPPEKVQVRSSRPDAGAAEQGGPMQPWEERRHHTEALVNQCLPTGAPGSTEVAYSFEARRKFMQVIAKQHRASDEQRFLAADRTNGAGGARSASTGGRLEASATGPLARSRGAGAFAQSAPGGIRGHFHSTCSANAEGHRWPPPADEVHLDGSHIDQTKARPHIEDVKMSTMTKHERGQQFSTQFGKALGDGHSLKKAAASDHASFHPKWENHRDHEFRGDNPDRHGKFGRRSFDPHVREKPVGNRHNVSEIEPKPMHEFYRQTERVHDFLDRSVPGGQARHFKTYQPKCEQPRKHQELATRAPVHAVLDGERKSGAMGFGQNRHSDRAIDMQLYTRPLGASHLDKMVPIS